MLYASSKPFATLAAHVPPAAVLLVAPAAYLVTPMLAGSWLMKAPLVAAAPVADLPAPVPATPKKPTPAAAPNTSPANGFEPSAKFAAAPPIAPPIIMPLPIGTATPPRAAVYARHGAGIDPPAMRAPVMREAGSFGHVGRQVFPGYQPAMVHRFGGFQAFGGGFHGGFGGLGGFRGFGGHGFFGGFGRR